MERGNMSRRGFMANMIGGLTAAGLPVWFAKELAVDAQEKGPAPRVGPNDRIIMGAIGTGTNRTRIPAGGAIRGERGIHIMQNAMRENGVQMIAVCDVDRPNGEFARDLVRNADRGGSRECQLLGDYRRLLENRDITAVTIGTPDHWHAPPGRHRSPCKRARTCIAKSR